MKWDSIFFDLDNTLFDYEETFKRTMCFSYDQLSCYNSWNVPSEEWFEVFKANCDRYWHQYENRIISEKKYKRLRYQIAMKDLDLPAKVEDADALQKMFYKHVSAFVEPYQGLYSLLDDLYERDIHLGIITNGRAVTQLEKIEQLSIDQWIPKQHIYISERFGRGKPDKTIFNVARADASPAIKRPLYIGDAWELDIVSAIEAGWNAIYLNTRNEPPTTNHITAATCITLDEVHKFLSTH
jgi:5'-nucleotidase